METARIKDYVDYLEMTLYLKINRQLKSSASDEQKERYLEIISDNNGKQFTKEKLDEEVLNNIMPTLIRKLKDGIFDYEWTIHHFYYNYEMLMFDPRLKDIYKKYLNFQEVNNAFTSEPVYFDAARLALNDEKYISYFYELINAKLYNPNRWNDFKASKPFYAFFTEVHSRFDNTEIINTVLLDERTDYNYLLNGSDCIEIWINRTVNHCEESKVLPTCFFLLERVLKEKNVSIIDGKRHNSPNYSFDVLGYIDQLINLRWYSNNKDIKNFLNYIVSDEYIQKQLNISKYPSLYRDDSIDTYCDFISHERGTNVNMLEKLKQLKLY